MNCGRSTRSSSTTEFSVSSGWALKAVGGEEWGKVSTIGLHLSVLIGTTSLPDMHMIRIIGFLFANRLHVSRMGEGRGVHRVLVRKPEGKRPLGRPRRRWEDNIKMDVQEVGGGCEDWMELAQDRDRWRALVGTVRNLRVPKMRGIS